MLTRASLSDILFLHMGFTPFRAGDIVVFKVADREIPIVHRIIKVWLMRGGATRHGAAPAPAPARARARATSGAREGERRGGYIDQGRQQPGGRPRPICR